MLDAPDLLDHLPLDRELGRGGMAVVYLAHDLKHDRKVALKALHRELAAALGRDGSERYTFDRARRSATPDPCS